MEFLSDSNIEEYESFVKSHKNGSFMQSYYWSKVKSEWKHEIIVSRNDNGEIIGSMLILIKTAPIFKYSLLYAPRGPVCNLYDKEVFLDLLSGVKELAKKYNAYKFTIDPFVLEGDEEFIKLANSLGFLHTPKLKDFETIQTRNNYMLLNLNDKTEDEVFKNFHNKWRYNVRVALKHNVECKVCGKEKLKDFYKLYEVTGKRDGFLCRPISYFEKMLDSFKDDISLYICYYNDQAISGSITTFYGNKACYVYGASDNSLRNVMPNHLMQWTMIKEALKRHCDTYDFQGIPVDLSGNSPMHGVYKFKKGFNGECVLFAGEFDYVLNTTGNKIVTAGMKTVQKAKKVRRKFLR